MIIIISKFVQYLVSPIAFRHFVLYLSHRTTNTVYQFFDFVFCFFVVNPVLTRYIGILREQLRKIFNISKVNISK